MTEYKQLVKSKTFWAGVGTICTSIGLLLSGEKQLQEFVIGIVGILFIWLRTVTNTGIQR